MNSFYYYKKKGYRNVEPKHKTISNIPVASTITLWTPTTNSRIALTDLAISSNIAGTMAFYFTNTSNNSHESKIAEFTLASSATIFPVISSWESTVDDAILAVRVSTGITNGFALTAGGFDIYEE